MTAGSDYDNLSNLPKGLWINIRRKNCSAQEKTEIGQYVDNCDGTITDTKTSLMWKRCPEGLSGENCDKGLDEKYNEWHNKWYDHNKDSLRDISYANYKDWRLPNIHELETLMHCDSGIERFVCKNENERPIINLIAFLGSLPSYCHISSNKYTSLGYREGMKKYQWKCQEENINNYSVRLVRGGQPAAQQ